MADQPEQVTRLLEAIKAFEAIEDDEACAAVAVSQALKDLPDHQVRLRGLRQRRVQAMKGQGKTWEEIGRRLGGVSAARAQQIAVGVSGAQRRKAQAAKQSEASDDE